MLCGHNEEPYYANDMCRNCYHRMGRKKKATDCEHTDRKLYAKGICKYCYLNKYYKKTKGAEKAAKTQSTIEKKKVSS